MQYFAYRHINGHIKVKHYSAEFGRDDLSEALESDFVESVTSVYEAVNRAEAERIAKEKLTPREQDPEPYAPTA